MESMTGGPSAASTSEAGSVFDDDGADVGGNDGGGDDLAPRTAASVPSTANGQSSEAAMQQSFWPDQGPGTSLPDSLRSSMEHHFGIDFSDVQVHTGSDAESAAANLGARAFTVGNHIHFGAGGFDASSDEGKRILAHELTHVAQGKAHGASSQPHALPDAAGAPAPQVSQPGEAAEVEAEAVAASFGKVGALRPQLSAKMDGAGHKIHLARTNVAGHRGDEPSKTPAASTKDSAFGPKVADKIPTDGVPKNWSRERIEDAIADYRASITTRKAEMATFDTAGVGSATQRKAHAKRISEEEAFLRSLEKALGSAR